MISPSTPAPHSSTNLAAADTYDSLENRVAAAITAADSPTADDRIFGELALAVYRFQRARNAPYDNYCRQLLGADVEITDWRAIPAAPQIAFKRFDLRAFPAEETARTFRTSGTTGEGWGSHHFRSLRLYEASIAQGWRHFGLPTGLPQLVLTPCPARAPHSSLAHMMDVLRAFAPLRAESGGDNARATAAPSPGGSTGDGQHDFNHANGDDGDNEGSGDGDDDGREQHFGLRDDGTLDFERVHALLSGWAREGRPALLLGTALAWLHLGEALAARGERLVLAPGTQLMETGGYKGTGRTLSKAELYALFGQRLGLPPEAVINEYGMTELSSPFYARGLGAAHHGPPWARALVIDPETDEEAAPGAVGAVRLFDLANVGSVLAIQTQDLAVRRPAAAGGGFELLGRDPAALPRGCSRAADEMMQGK